ncbi:MlaD family protein [Sediminicoccus sp. KRV36]|uniref:MlaD family protein n=1 Tax=Sediminicoccus sp. KRV36 TaxID=3133721 RepID=UPI00200EFBA9|nr:MlaD family protein [Sediminicoccus rosea]UPY37519.1 MlaD family protein [Sediminicoccus rosea]
MASIRRIQLSVGLMVVVGLALLVGFVLFLTQNRLSTSDVLFETYIRESVQGLEVGSPVRYRGVSVGRVTEIALAAAEYRRPEGEGFAAAFQLVVVRFAVNLRKVGDVPSTDEAVAAGLRARMASQGITGVAYIEMDFLDADRFPVQPVPWTPRFAWIPAVPSTVAQVTSAAEMLVRQVQGIDFTALVGNINDLVLDLRRQTDTGDLAVTLREASALMQDLRSIAGQADLPGAVAELRATSAAVRALAEGREVRETLSALSATAQDLRRTTARLPGTIGQLESSLRAARNTTTDVQADLAPLLRDLRATTANLRETTEALRRSPSQAILGAPPPAPAGASR